MAGFLVHCDRHWIGNQVMGPISFACNEDKYSKLLETICHRIGVSSERFHIRISSELTTAKGTCTLSIMSNVDVSCLFSHNQSSWTEIKVEVVERFVPPEAAENVFQTPMKSRNTTIHSCIPSVFKPSSNSKSPVDTQYFKSVSGSNQQFGSVPSPRFTTAENVEGSPASTNKHAEDVVDDSDSSETSNTDDETCSNGQESTGGELFSRSFSDLERNLRPKDIICDMREKHGINLSYNKAYRSKDRALHSVFGDPWELFNMLPAYFHIPRCRWRGSLTAQLDDREAQARHDGTMAHDGTPASSPGREARWMCLVRKDLQCTAVNHDGDVAVAKPRSTPALGRHTFVGGALRQQRRQ
ncbi:hypothetical protein Dsin_000522 [Dipteronia sinensis]|uniref:Uncharacterized protein n=1 Tax=Dipteronia sinensis TaxID=43782 RepID=A0AAE0B224_9ROSI|nr:hypothetical protein Dsin_000522 [Dipteronia sinensis]